jgi:hypothetical protein
LTANGSFAVFEALNHARKEILVGVTSVPVPEFVRGRKEHLPVEVAHWEAADDVTFRRLAENMPAADAWQFVDLYAFYIGNGDWSIIRQQPHARDSR